MPHSITDGTTEESSAGQMTHIAGGSYGHYFYETKARRGTIASLWGLAAAVCMYLVIEEWYQSDSTSPLIFAVVAYYVGAATVQINRKAKVFPSQIYK